MIAAWLAGAVVILSAAYIGDIRAAIQAAFPEQYACVVGALVIAAIAVAAAAAAVRIREQRARRFGAMALAMAGAAAWFALFRTGDANVDAVEAFHFVEYGLLAGLFYRASTLFGDARRLIYPLLAGLVVGIGDEFLQWYLASRVGELHDIALNLAALCFGLLFAIALDPPPRTALGLDGAGRRVAVALLGGVVLLALFVYAVHAGYDVRDPEIGAFRSRYRAEQLRQLAAARAPVWQHGLPADQGRFAREDHYLSEALWHVQERNEAIEIGDTLTAWRENRILEKFYAPLLESPALARRFRWNAEQRSLIGDAAAGANGAPYRSRAHPLPIYVW